MSDGHLCTRWFERRLGCPFDGESWHTFSYDPDEEFHFSDYPPEPEEGGKKDQHEIDYDQWLDYSGLQVPSIAFTNMGYYVYGSLLLQQQKALGMKPSYAPALSVSPFTSTGVYLQMVEAAEIAVATRVATGNTPNGLGQKETSSTLKPPSLGETAAVILWSAAIGAATYWGTKSPGGQAAFAAVKLVPPAEALAFLAMLGSRSPGIQAEAMSLFKATLGAFLESDESYKDKPKWTIFDPHGQEISEIGVV